MDNKEKIILKQQQLPGVDLALYDFNRVSAVRPLRTKVVLSMYKRQGMTYIGLQGPAEAGEIIQVGNLELKYRIIKGIKVLPKGGFLYRIKRVDGHNITQTDLDAVEIGQTVKFKSRRTFTQLMNYPPQT